MDNRSKENIIFNSVLTDNFSATYPFINNELVNNGDFVNSRNGDTREVIDFKTEITNPYKRLVGNNKRDMNVFFLMAESLWIWAGRKDLAFLNKFNSQMKNYSDDGINFHAPYGFRLRHHGLSSADNPQQISEENKHSSSSEYFTGKDQIKESLLMFDKDKDSRRVVMQIWDSNLDLNKNSKDLPCNDLIFFKIRNGKLRTTISNRSNDLHWGLPTNVYQFSFITEIMSQILGIELGTQTHNSQSLHFYVDNPIAMNMRDEFILSDGKFEDLYDNYGVLKMNFNFVSDDVENKLKEVDFYVNKIIESLEKGIILDEKFEHDLLKFDSYFYQVYKLLFFYINYQDLGDKSDTKKLSFIKEIEDLSGGEIKYDFQALAINFFSSKLKDKSMVKKYVYNF
jgi:thymidylate synthase